MFMYTCGNGVNGFTLDPAVGSFLLSHENIRVPEKKNIYSVNEGYYELFDENMKKYLHAIKKGENRTKQGMLDRWWPMCIALY